MCDGMKAAFFSSTKKKVELEWRRSKSVLSKISCFEFKTISWCHTKIRYVCIFRVRKRKLEMKEAWSFWKKDDLSKSNNWERKEWTFISKFNNFLSFIYFLMKSIKIFYVRRHTQHCKQDIWRIMDTKW